MNSGVRNGQTRPSQHWSICVQSSKLELGCVVQSQTLTQTDTDKRSQTQTLTDADTSTGRQTLPQNTQTQTQTDTDKRAHKRTHFVGAVAVMRF